MIAMNTATMPLESQYTGTSAHPLGTSVESLRSGLDTDTRALLSIFGRTLYLLGLATIGVVAITGLPPLFFMPLALFLFFGSCLQWRQASRVRACPQGRQTETDAASPARHDPFVVYEDKA